MKAHGTRTMYACGCRCLPCCAEESRYQRARYATKRTGRRRIVDAAEAKGLILALRRRGLSHSRIADQTGLHRNHVQRLSTGRRACVFDSTVRTLAALMHAKANDGGRGAAK